MPSAPSPPNWIVCQIGAREDYTVPRALHRVGRLDHLFTDIWARPGSLIGKCLARTSVFTRWHPDLANARVRAPNSASFVFGFFARSRPYAPSWSTTIGRNKRFQQACVRHLESIGKETPGTPKTIFAFSYAARDIFRFARERGWTTVLGQIDPGPYEETLVAREHQQYPQAASTWKPAPPEYWDHWREETQLADHIVVNSPWARDGLLAAGVNPAKIRIVPLYCERDAPEYHQNSTSPTSAPPRLCGIPENASAPPLQVLFIGRVGLRKGIARLIDAMRLLRDEPVELHIYGTLSVSPDLWHDLPNVRWEGGVKHSEIQQVYSAADVFILPTVSDGFARTQLEALACGTQVIASRNCGNVIINGVNGFLLEHNTPQEIAALLANLAADRSLLRNCDTTRLPVAMPRSLDELAAKILEAAPTEAPASAKGEPVKPPSRLKSLVRSAASILALMLAAGFAVGGWIEYGGWPNIGPPAAVENPALILVLGGENSGRANESLRLAEKFRETPILVTGDGGHIIKRLLENGIGSDRIGIEPYARDTHANATLSAPWVRDTRGNIVIVTSDFHAPRAVAVFRKVFPEHHFTVSYQSSELDHAIWEANARRERAAALYYLVRYRVNSFRN